MERGTCRVDMKVSFKGRKSNQEGCILNTSELKLSCYKNCIAEIDVLSKVRETTGS